MKFLVAYQAQGFGEPVFKPDPQHGQALPHAFGGTFELELREPKPEEVRDMLRQMAGIEDEYERERAFRELNFPGVLEALIKAIEFENQPSRQRALVIGVASILNVEATRQLIALCEDLRVVVRETALDW